jgi:DegV family protein with EDD domain
MDGVDPREEFYALLAEDATPTTAAPSPAVFAETYRGLAGGADQVLSIHMMDTKSRLIESARAAAAGLPEGAVSVVDTGTVSLGQGLLVTAAARAAQAGQSLSQIVALLERLRKQVYFFAAIPQLTQLRRSGRVSLGTALMAGLLAIKPVLYVGQSVVEVVDKVRGWQAAVSRMTDLLEERVQGARVWLTVGHTNDREAAEGLLASVRSRFNCLETFVVDGGSAIAAHAGAGALGLAALVLPEPCSE